MSFDRASLQRAVRSACELDVTALKPGNVSVDAPGYGMTAADFLASAEAIAGPITMPGLSVGARIFTAIEATQKVVNCNTNLGIVLLLAPIIQAAEASQNFASVQPELQRVLNGLTIDDAQWAYRAIRLAKPGGMGKRAEHDITEVPRVTLVTAMQEAADHDQIAQLYITGFRTLFELALPVWRNAMQCWNSPIWATAAVFLKLLEVQPDSLITRKFGRAKSEAVSSAAKLHRAALEAAADPRSLRDDFLNWDATLKSGGLNPGTTADMTVATVFLAHLQDMR